MILTIKESDLATGEIIDSCIRTEDIKKIYSDSYDEDFSYILFYGEEEPIKIHENFSTLSSRFEKLEDLFYFGFKIVQEVKNPTE